MQRQERTARTPPFAWRNPEASRVSLPPTTLSSGAFTDRIPHVRGRAGARQEVLARRREDVDDLGVLRKPRLVLDAARNDAEIARPARATLGAQSKVHAARDHPEHLLVRMAMSGGVGAGLHRPPHDHLVVTDEDPTADLVGDLFLRQIAESVKPLHQHVLSSDVVPQASSGSILAQ